MTIEITCGQCGHRFPTNATTATRCRRCKHSVRIGSAGRPAGPHEVLADQETADSDVAWVIILAVTGLGWAIWKVWVWRRKRRDDASPSVETE